jgi:hypothetical protein
VIDAADENPTTKDRTGRIERSPAGIRDEDVDFADIEDLVGALPRKDDRRLKRSVRRIVVTGFVATALIVGSVIGIRAWQHSHPGSAVPTAKSLLTQDDIARYVGKNATGQDYDPASHLNVYPVCTSNMTRYVWMMPGTAQSDGNVEAEWVAMVTVAAYPSLATASTGYATIIGYATNYHGRGISETKIATPAEVSGEITTPDPGALFSGYPPAQIFFLDGAMVVQVEVALNGANPASVDTSSLAHDVLSRLPSPSKITGQGSLCP